MTYPRWTIAAIIILLLAVLFFLPRHDQKTADPTGIIAQVRELNQLATVRYTLQRLVTLTEQKQPVGSESILLILQVTVDAGVDLSALPPSAVVRKPDGSLAIRLPEARILNAAIDESQTRVWDRTKTWWTPWVGYSKDLEHNARLAGLDSARQAALDMGILHQAESNAERSISTLLRLAGARDVQFIRGS